MDPISLQELALLEVLQRIDQRAELVEGDGEVMQRLIDSGLADHVEGEPTLTAGGVELCKSLQHRVAADAEAERIRREREENEASGGESIAKLA